jgi:hypothetical protein
MSKSLLSVVYWFLRGFQPNENTLVLLPFDFHYLIAFECSFNFQMFRMPMDSHANLCENIR